MLHYTDILILNKSRLWINFNSLCGIECFKFQLIFKFYSLIVLLYKYSELIVTLNQ